MSLCGILNTLCRPEHSGLGMPLMSEQDTSYVCMMMMIMTVMNCFCAMVDQWKAFSLISSWDHCQRSSPSRISDTPRAGFEPAQNLSSGLVEWSCAVVITAIPWTNCLYEPICMNQFVASMEVYHIHKIFNLIAIFIFQIYLSIYTWHHWGS